MKTLDQRIEEIVKAVKLNELNSMLFNKVLRQLISDTIDEVIGEDESEIQDRDRQLYFVGKNDLRHEQRTRKERVMGKKV